MSKPKLCDLPAFQAVERALDLESRKKEYSEGRSLMEALSGQVLGGECRVLVALVSTHDFSDC